MPPGRSELLMRGLGWIAAALCTSGCSLLIEGYTFADDAGTADGGGGSIDGGSVDAGTPPDAGRMDAGTDGGTPDGGPPDAGPPPAVVEVALGDRHACARLEDGTVRCWGSNEFGQLGDGTMVDRHRPTEIALTDVVQLDLGVGGSCARLMDGTARCWGVNDRGQVGDDSRVQKTEPTPVSGLTGLVDISRAWDGAYAVTSAGAVMGWGSADFGILPGTSEDALVPVTIAGLADIEQVSGYGSACALDGSSNVYCWGPNPLGQLGDGTTMERTGPVQSAGSSGMAAQVGAGAFHACVRNLDGTVLCFGHGVDGEIGDGGFDTPVPDPTSTGLTNVTRLGVGHQHTCVVRSPAGAVLCWGRNDEGEVGDGSTTNRPSPVLVTLRAPAADIAAGLYFTCAVLTDGSLWCWGANDVGQLGDGTTTDASEPVLVRF